MKSKVLSRQSVSTAIFEYLVNRGFKPDRKDGVWYPEPMAGVVVKVASNKAFDKRK
jgi:hypothetical protein